jgi:thiol-disulfide isomerase/thioredoxin
MEITMKRWIMLALLGLALAASPAFADRTQIYSVTGVDCADCGTPIKARLKMLKGVKKVDFDIHKAEVEVTMNDRVTDDTVLAAIAQSGAGFHGTVGPGKGAYLPFGEYPKGSDVILLTETGAAVGPFEKLRVAGKYTVFDLFADWCGPCRAVDAQLREIVEHRNDVAVRKLNVIDFQSPLAREQGPKLKGLPYVVVFSPTGKRTDLMGNDAKKLASALGGK